MLASSPALTAHSVQQMNRSTEPSPLVRKESCNPTSIGVACIALSLFGAGMGVLPTVAKPLGCCIGASLLSMAGCAALGDVCYVYKRHLNNEDQS